MSLIACSGEDAGLSSATPSPIEQRAPSPGGATGVPHSYLCVPVQFAQALPGTTEGQAAQAPASSAPGVCRPYSLHLWFGFAPCVGWVCCREVALPLGLDHQASPPTFWLSLIDSKVLLPLRLLKLCLDRHLCCGFPWALLVLPCAAAPQ